MNWLYCVAGKAHKPYVNLHNLLVFVYLLTTPGSKPISLHYMHRYNGCLKILRMQKDKLFIKYDYLLFINSNTTHPFT